MASLIAVAMPIAAACFVTALFDMAINGNGGARWAPYGIALAILLGIPAYIMVN